MKDKEENEKSAILRVAEAYHRDAGRGIARIAAETMRELGVVSGDVIEIEGKNIATAIVWPGYSPDRGKSLVRIDGNIRANAGVAIDDRVRVKKTRVKEAKRITLEPTQPVRIAGGERYIARILKGRPITKGQIIRVEMLGNPITFVVTNTVPLGTVIPQIDTEIVLRKAREEAIGVPHVTYEDIGGLQREIGMIREMIELPLRHPELFERLGIDPPKGVLLHGPPGTGKTLIAKAVATETDANFYSISGPEIMSKFYGESEKHLRDIFEVAGKNAPSIIFIDELDSIAPKRGETTGEVERRVVAQLLSLMDGLESRGQVVVVGATNRVNALDEALRRGGRFDREVEIGIPNRDGREEILQVHSRGMPLAEDEKDKIIKELANLTHGFVGADLATLCKEAAMHALRKILPEIDIEKEIPPEVMEKLKVTKEDFSEALKNTEPSALREVFVEVPNVKWDDIGGLERVKEELKEVIEWPLKYADAFSRLNSKPPKGILLFGPPGTGKTMLVKAIANATEVNFISIKGPELLCISGETPIFTDHCGLRPVETFYADMHHLGEIEMERENVEVIKLKEPVYTFGINNDGKLTKTLIKRIYKLYVPTTYKIGFSNNSEIVVSANQPFLTCASGIKWIKAEDLKVGDMIATPSTLSTFELQLDFKLPKYKHLVLVKEDHDFYYVKIFSRKEITRIPKKLTPELAEFLGWFVSEGNVSKDAVTLCGKDEDNVKRFKELFQIFVDEHRVKWRYMMTTVYSTPLIKFLEELLGMRLGKKKSDCIVVPSVVFKANEEVITSFLRGLWSGDGHIDDKKIEYGTMSEKLAFGITYLLTQLGIKSKYWRRKDELNMVTISGKKEMQRFKHLVYGDDKTLRMIAYGDLYWVNIVNKEKANPQIMFDVETEASSFVGGELPMVLHNSKWVGESLPYSEEILTLQNDSISRIPIGEVVEKEKGVKVVTFDEKGEVKYANISEYIKHPLKKKIKQIKTVTGRKIRITDDHSLFSFNGREIVSVKAEELKEGESYVVIPKSIPSFASHRFEKIDAFEALKEEEGIYVKGGEEYVKEGIKKIGYEDASRLLGISKRYLHDIVLKKIPVEVSKFCKLTQVAGIEFNKNKLSLSVKGSKNTFPALFYINEDVCRTMGLWIAEGDYQNYSVRINNANEAILSDVFDSCRRLGLSVSKGEDWLTINSKIFRIFMEKVLSVKGGAKNKEVPDIIWSLERSLKASFLRGYYSGDGFIHGNSHRYVIGCSTESKKLANDILYLLLEFGIVAKMREKKEWNGNISYSVEFMGVENFKQFIDIGFIDEKRNRKIKDYIQSKKWPRSDQIPLKGELKELVTKVRSEWKKSSTIGRNILKEILEKIDPEKKKYKNYWYIVEGNIRFDKVVQIRDLSTEDEYVYDVSVNPTESFLAGFGGIFAHNSERAVREVFRKAKQAAPCIIFLDEIDSIAPVRGAGYDSHVAERVVSQMLIEMDGLEELKEVIIIAATNRPDMVDPALLRPGRLDRLIYIQPPGKEERKKIFDVHLRGKPIGEDVDVEELAERTDGYVGADIAAIVKEAVMSALREFITSGISEEHVKEAIQNIVIKKQHFETGIKSVRPTVTPKAQEEFEGKAEDFVKYAYA